MKAPTAKTVRLNNLDAKILRGSREEKFIVRYPVGPYLLVQCEGSESFKYPATIMGEFGVMGMVRPEDFEIVCDPMEDEL